MNIKIRILPGLILILAGLFPLSIYAQQQEQQDSVALSPALMAAMSNNVTSRVNVIPPTPQSEKFQKYIHHEVAGYNGLPEIEVPLYEINLRGFTIPINLSYHASGVKFRQFDGDVGPGWDMTVGGLRVIRNIYGRPDELFPMYNPTTLQQKQQNQGLNARGKMEYDGFLGRILFENNDGVQYPFMYATSGSYMDGEYDLFTYLLPFGSGEFIISNRSQKQVTSANIDQSKIELDEGKTTLTLENIKITDNQGYIYYFGGKQADGQELAEYTHSYFGNYRTAWLLRKIVTPYNEEINFKYQFHLIAEDSWGGGVYTIQDASTRLTSFVSNTHTVSEGRFTETPINNFRCAYLNEISTPHETVTIKRKTPSGATGATIVTPLVESISITEKLSGQMTKQFRMEYLLRPTGTIGAYTPRHNLLGTVRIGNGTTFSTENKYTFSYYEVSSSNNNDFYPDQWGYIRLNGSALQGKRVLHQEFGDHEYLYNNNHFQTHWKVRNVSFSGLPNIFVNRASTSAGPIWLSLKQITFPTGGNTTYEYESNRFKVGNDVVYGGGLRVKKITSDAANGTSPVITEFTYGKDEDGIGRTMYADVFGYKHLWAFADEQNYYYSDPESWSHGVSPHIDRLALIRQFYTKPSVKDMEAFMQVQYPEYTKRSYDKDTKKYNGKIIYSYSMNNSYGTKTFYGADRQCELWSREYNYGNNFIGVIRRGYKPLLSAKHYYNTNNVLVKEEAFNYNWVSTATFAGVRVKQKNFMEPSSQWDYENSTSNFHPYNFFRSFFGLGSTSLSLHNTQISQYTETNYNENGEQPVQKTTNYTYDTLKRISKITENNSQSGNRITTYTYPASGTALYTKNKIATPIQTVTENNGKEIERVKYTYASTKITPDYVETSNSGTANLQREITYDTYDDRGNIRQYTGRDGIPVTYIWGYNKKYPVAEIVGADLAKVRTLIPETALTALANRTAPTTAEWTELNKLITSTQMAGTSVTLYKYKPLVGVTEMTSPSGQVTLYTYDNFGRLTQVSLKVGNTTQIIESYSYNYKNK